MPITLRTCTIAAAVCLAAGVGRTSAAQQSPIPTTFTNLQVLPRDIGQRALVDMMKGFTSALGVRCLNCHVGEGNDLFTYHFASDEKPMKRTARRMIAMLRVINDDLLQGVGNPASGSKVTCYTCHRGARRPATQPDGGSNAPPRR